MKRLCALALALPLLLGCAQEDPNEAGAPGPTRTTPSPSAASPTDRAADESSPAQPSPAPTESKSAVVELWFSVATDTPAGVGLFPVSRTVTATPAIGATAVREWLAGPTPEEHSAGIRSTVPAGTELLDLNIDGGTAIVDLSSEFESPGVGSFEELLRLEQLAWTLTQFPTVERVLLRIEGRDKESFMSHGFVIDEDHPLQRDDDDPLAPIIVTSPGAGERFRSGDSVQGNANVFEANVSLRLVASDGTVLFEGFTTASCGTGCRGDFSESIEFQSDAEQRGQLEVFESSAKDGSEINKIVVPVVLTT